MKLPKLLNRALNPLGLIKKTDTPTGRVTKDAYEAVVSSIQRESSRAVTLEFELLEGYRLNYKAGQFVTITLPIGATLFQRCYCFSSAPYEERYAITVQESFHGRVSHYLTKQLKVGDRFFIDDPSGGFVLPTICPQDQRYLMVAGGIGIAPIYSLIKDLLSKNFNAEIQLVYASRNADQAVFLRALEKLAHRHPGFSLRTQFTRRADNSHDPYRRLNGDKIVSRVSDPSSAFIYVSGPFGLVRKCADSFQDLGIPESRIQLETFTSPPASLLSAKLEPRGLIFVPPTGALGRPRKFRPTRVETVLESARQAQAQITQQCSSGTCGHCKVKVKKGAVLMDEPNSLSIEEAKAGYVLSCMAYPCEPLVIKLPHWK